MSAKVVKHLAAPQLIGYKQEKIGISERGRIQVKVYAVDWGYKEGKTVFFDGVKATSKEPALAGGDIIATENMPHHKKVEFHHKGVKVLTCSTNMTAERRRQLNLEKDDETDAEIIYNEYFDWKDGISNFKFREFVYDIELEQLSYQVKVRREAVEARKKLKQRVSLDPILRNILDDDVKESKNYVSRLETKLKHRLKNFEVYNEWLADINGVGVASCAELIAIIKDIKRFDTVSKLWAYFGLDVRNGKAPKRTKGQLANWSQRGRSLILNDIVSNGFKMNGAERVDDNGEVTKDASLWRSRYDEYKQMELDKNEDREEDEKLSNGHMDKRAIRRTGKQFLKELWVYWNQLEKTQ